jgi:hypothetical protein
LQSMGSAGVMRIAAIAIVLALLSEIRGKASRNAAARDLHDEPNGYSATVHGSRGLATLYGDE